MKKMALLLVLAFVLPAAASAYEFPYGREGKIMASVENLMKEADKKNKEQLQKAQEDAKKAEEEEKAKEKMRITAQQEAQKATEALLALQEAYPEYAEEVARFSRIHTYFVGFADGKNAKSRKEAFGNIFMQLEYFYSCLEDLPEEVSNQVYEIMNHQYWIQFSEYSYSLRGLGPAAKRETGVFDSDYF